MFWTIRLMVSPYRQYKIKQNIKTNKEINDDKEVDIMSQ